MAAAALGIASSGLPPVQIGAALDSLQRLLQIGFQIVDVFDADGQAHHVLGHACKHQFLRSQLAVRGGRRMAGERLGIAYVYETSEQLQRILELRACRCTALDAECQYPRGTPAQVFLRQRVILVVAAPSNCAM